ncbi:iron-sulfur cluster assembly scaffold protein [Myxococcota bacterium]|nr:iron-sulfur cluster assembly scaffold protein [Myxococcota bacterium]MBU1535922.1 iron-sulfur cluster assembly scaffold protein [Myxococcota bacterium]
MESPEVSRHLIDLYGVKIAQEALSPHHLGVMQRPHATGTHEAANGDWVTFYLTIEEGRVQSCWFTAQGNAVIFAGASVTARLVQGMQIRHALSHLDVPALMEELGEVSEADQFSLILVCEALEKALKQSIVYIREPWKTLYTTNR